MLRVQVKGRRSREVTGAAVGRGRRTGTQVSDPRLSALTAPLPAWQMCTSWARTGPGASFILYPCAQGRQGSLMASSGLRLTPSDMAFEACAQPFLGLCLLLVPVALHLPCPAPSLLLPHFPPPSIDTGNQGEAPTRAKPTILFSGQGQVTTPNLRHGGPGQGGLQGPVFPLNSAGKQTPSLPRWTVPGVAAVIWG